MEKISLEVHDYDGHLQYIKDKMNKYSLELSIEESIAKLSSMHNDINYKKSLIFLLNNKEKNIDTSDSINTNNLIILIAQKVKDPIESYILEQISDIITSGSCLQGRSKRLSQIFLALYNV